MKWVLKYNSNMNLQQRVPLGAYTSFGCGGPAEELARCGSHAEIKQALQLRQQSGPVWILGYGTNVLISDEGLPGLTLVYRGGQISFEKDDLLVAEGGAWWDKLVQTALGRGLWGLELTSGIPSSVGAAVTGNIAAYGQQISDRLSWAETVDVQSQEVKRLPASSIDFSYRRSSLQTDPQPLVLRAAFSLSGKSTTKLAYASALKVADELKLDPRDLQARRQIIMETRRQAGSLYDPDQPNPEHTAGSFFKNPHVTLQQAEQIAGYDETGKTLEQLLEQNKIHGGTTHRVSAAHVLLAAGFARGQQWGQVRLHPDHILKIQNLGGARSQDIYNVAQQIIQTVQDKLLITLEPEVKFLGSFATN